MNNATYRFDPIDFVERHRWVSLSPAQRLETMLNARELAVGLIRGQLSKCYPNLTWPALNLKVLQRLNGVTSKASPNFNLFFAILQTLEAIQAPYMIIGAFAATIYGATHTTRTATSIFGW